MNRMISAIVEVIGITDAGSIPHVFSTHPANMSGNPMSPPPRIAVRTGGGNKDFAVFAVVFFVVVLAVVLLSICVGM